MALADDIAAIGRGFAVGGAVVLALASIVVLPDKLQGEPPAAPVPAQVGTVTGLGAGEPFPGWNRDVEQWAADNGWATMPELSARWSDPAPTTVTQITPTR